MKIKTKVVSCVIVAVLWGFAMKILTPAAQLAANSVIVDQLDSSDAASLAVTTVGDGSSWIRIAVNVVALLALYFILRSKTQQDKDDSK